MFGLCLSAPFFPAAVPVFVFFLRVFWYGQHLRTETPSVSISCNFLIYSLFLLGRHRLPSSFISPGSSILSVKWEFFCNISWIMYAPFPSFGLFFGSGERLHGIPPFWWCSRARRLSSAPAPVVPPAIRSGLFRMLKVIAPLF